MNSHIRKSERAVRSLIKKVLAVALIIITVSGSLFSIKGFGEREGIAGRMRLGLDMVGGVSVLMEAQTDLTGGELAAMMEQVRAVMENRVNEFGLSEPVITLEGAARIRIDLPGAQNAAAAIEMIGQTAQLSFRTADGEVVVTGSNVRNASSQPYSGYESQLIGTYTIAMEFDPEGAASFEAATRAILAGKIHSSDERYQANQILIYLDDRVISEPSVTTVITGTKSEITGRFDAEGAAALAALIRGGSLPVPLLEIQTEVIGPTLGLDAARSSVIAGAVGIALILILMLAAYRLMGLVADVCLILYVLIVLWAMIGLKAVLTLPGIAGLILSVGMAVDSNVLIFSRIREELAHGKSVRVAVQSGYKRAMSTIIDSQVTTVIAAVLLYQFGTGSVRGFATTLLIGIIASLFTAVAASQVLLELLAESRLTGRTKAFGHAETGGTQAKKSFGWIEHRRYFYAFSAALIAVGLIVGGIRGFNKGIDFTGGTMMQLNIGREISVSQAENLLSGYGIDADIQHAGAENEKIIIRTTRVLDSAEREALADDLRQSLAPDADTATFVEQEGLIGPAVGAQLKTNAIKSILFASLAMLAYIAVRFEWKFGIAAILALLHDGLMLWAFYGLFHIQLNSPFIAGLLIVIGYSINDTIVIFDRIRENLVYMKKSKLEELIDTSITQSLGRSMMTSLTTALAILPLVLLSGSAVRAFALPLIAGVAFGTMSSITIASGLYYTIYSLVNKPKYRKI